MKTKKSKPLLWLLLIPGQFAAVYLFMRFGAFIDILLFTDSEGFGHGIPFFSVLFLIISLIITAIVIPASVFLAVKGFKKQKGGETK